MLLGPGDLGPIEIGGGLGPIGLIIGSILSLLSLLFGNAPPTLSPYQINGIVSNAMGFVGSLLNSVWSFLSGFLERIVNAIKWLWDNVFKRILTDLGKLLSKLHKWLEDHLRPVIDFLKKVRKYLQDYYTQHLLPMLRLIQRIRQYLIILSFLHIHIAQQLDQWLAQLQAKLVQNFATMVAIVNTLIDLGNALVDPNYLIRHPVLLISIRRQIPALIHAVTGRPPGYFFPSPRGASGIPFAPVPFDFNPSDPSQNPPTSDYLGNDGVGDLSGYTDGFTYLNGAVDQVGPLDYFNDDLYPEPVCSDPAQCLAQALQAVLPGTYAS